jgi:parallel beta-helix repeat protein
MRKGWIIGSVLILLLIVGLPVNSLELSVIKDINNNPFQIYQGNTLYVGGSGPGNYTKIQDAIDNASHGDTVFVYDDSSPYLENIVVNISLNLFGEEKNTTIIDGNGLGNVVSVNFANVHITGFTIQNSGDNHIYDAGIKIRKSNNHLIQNNIIRYNHFGLFLYISDFNDIFDNNIYENYIGIETYWDGKYNTIKNNKISNNERHGINLYHSQYSTVTENIIEKNGFHFIGSYTGGIYLGNGAKTNLIFDNVISNNYHGIFVRSGYRYNKISKNMILNNAFCGIVLAYYSFETEIVFNHIEGNGRFGLYIDKSEYNNISKNNFIDNKEKNIVSLCFLFQGNKLKWSENYYDDYKGFGSKIILGLMKSTREFDSYTPYFWIPWINFDRNPAKFPYDITTLQGCGIE